jgi:hypothetical protein
MNWAQRLKCVINIDVKICSRCGGAVKIIACTEDLSVIKKILEHLNITSVALPQSINCQNQEPHRKLNYGPAPCEQRVSWVSIKKHKDCYE